MAFEELRKIRLEKLERLKRAGLNVFPASPAFSVSEISSLKKDFRRRSKGKKLDGAAGRIMAKREHGGSIFADLFDGSGKIQVFIAKDKIGDESFNLFSGNIDGGDFIAVEGKAFYTKKKEPTLEVSRWQILAKALRPLPEKWHGLQDVEERFRKRYLDLLMNAEVRERFLVRSKVVSILRELLDREGYVEVETPILQPLYGGALAEPFKTHHRMLDIDMYLRIAPELYLKRLLVGGFGKVYEIGKNFRNEGIDATHNPEFTTIELYASYQNASHLKNFITKILFGIIRTIIKKNFFKFAGHDIKFPSKIPNLPFWQILERHALITHPEKLSRDDFLLRAKQLGLSPDPRDDKAKIANEIFSKICRPKLVQPVFVVNHPIEISPLAKNLPEDKKLVDRFQLIVGGIELVNGFSELNDPTEQRARFEMQEEFKKKEDREAHPMDEEFIEALEYGMPPAAGLAVSIDRIAMLLTDTHNIKEVILFPTLKPKE